MYLLRVLVAVAAASAASAAIVNVEFKFTPFVGDLKSTQVNTVPGTARVLLNNVLCAEQAVTEKSVPVMFDEREVAPAIWISGTSLAPLVRKGRNRIRIEFEPAKPAAEYRTQVSWAEVNDTVAAGANTNQSGEGMENKAFKGKMAFEREFQADFATDQPWHHYPPVTSLNSADKQQIIGGIKERLDLYKPANFKTAYGMLTALGLKGEAASQDKCLEKAFAIGVRVLGPAAAPEQYDFVTTGNPEVLVRMAGNRPLFSFNDPMLFHRIPDPKDDGFGLCANLALVALYPPQMLFVRNPAGVWRPAF